MIFRLWIVSAMLAATQAWSPVSNPSRRQAFAQVIATTTTAAGVSLAVFQPEVARSLPTEETSRVVTRMGGSLEAFQDGGRSIRMMVPSGKYCYCTIYSSSMHIISIILLKC
jgi:hypothetical protein